MRGFQFLRILVCFPLVAIMATKGNSQSIDCECDSYPTPNELEPNFGLSYTSPVTQHMPDPKYVIHGFSVSPDGHWLAFMGGWHKFGTALLLKDLRSGEIKRIPGGGLDPQWSPDSKTIAYNRFTTPDLEFYDIQSESIYYRWSSHCDTTPFCLILPRWAPDGELYSYNCYNENHGSVPGLYRILLDSTDKVGCMVRQHITRDPFFPTFPPHTIQWNTAYLEVANYPGMTPDSVRYIKGFYVIDNLDWQSRRATFIRLDTIIPREKNWIFDYSNAWGIPDNRLALYSEANGTCGDIYRHLSIRHQREWEEDIVPPFSEAELEARAASGWYRMDTLGRGLVQIARSWSNLGISITGDGETIYYGVMMPDSTQTIWAMDKCGRNKRQVVFPTEDPNTHLLDADGSVGPTGSERGEAYVHPNPSVQSPVSVVFSSKQIGQHRIQIFDASGRAVSGEIIREVYQVGEQHLSLSLEPLPSGVYTIRILPPSMEGITITHLIVTY